MSAKLANFLALVLYHLITRWVDAGAEKYRQYKHEKQVKAEAKKKMEEHRNATTREERRRTFGGLSVLAFCFLLTGFSGCGSGDLALNLTTENCELDPVEVVIEGKRYIDVEQTVCFCRDYKYSLGYVGPVGVVRDESYDHCKQMPGFPKWEEPSAFWEIVRSKILTATGRKK